jgi:hypothetical protein
MGPVDAIPVATAAGPASTVEAPPDHVYTAPDFVSAWYVELPEHPISATLAMEDGTVCTAVEFVSHVTTVPLDFNAMLELVAAAQIETTPLETADGTANSVLVPYCHSTTDPLDFSAATADVASPV